MPRRSPLRPARFDDLGLRRALSDRLLPLLVAAMAFLGGLTLAGVFAAAGLAEHWRGGAAATVTLQVPRPRWTGPNPADPTRIERAVALLRGTPGITDVRVLGDDELAELLKPWLGTAARSVALPLPGVAEIRLAPGEAEPDDGLQARLEAAVPGAVLEGHGVWQRRLSALARSLQLCAGAALLLVAGVAAAVVAVATRAGLAARRDAIEIVHGLGATDGFIAARFANRATALTTVGGCLGTAIALPVVLALAGLAAPLSGLPEQPGLPSLPVGLWVALPVLPLAAAAIGWVTAQATVRRWLRRLP